MKIDLTLQANFWNTSPSISIKLDNKVIREFNNFVDKQNTIISIETGIEDGEHQLVIEQQNKSIKDTVLEDSKIIKDSTINIVDVVINKVSDLILVLMMQTGR